jgi:hypothetical protein
MKSRVWVLVAMLLQATVASANLPFIRDDYARARAEANRRKLPMFVEVWAPW